MAALQLSKEELLYLSVLTGTDNLWGFEDPFQEKSEAEIRADILELQNTLLRKGCLEAKIDGFFSVTAAYQSLLETSMKSERVYILCSSQLESEHAQLRFFVNGGTVIRYQYNEEALLSFSSKDLMKAEIVSFFGDVNSSEQPYSLVTGVSRLRRMGSLSKQHFLQELRSSGCEEELALLIADGLQGNSVFCSLLAYDRKDNQEVLAGKVVTLKFYGGSLMVTPDNKTTDSVRFTCLDHVKLLSVLNELLGKEKEVGII